MRSEQEARQQIVKNWAKYPASDKRLCVNTADYNASYVQWLNLKNKQLIAKGSRVEEDHQNSGIVQALELLGLRSFQKLLCVLNSALKHLFDDFLKGGHPQFASVHLLKVLLDDPDGLAEGPDRPARPMSRLEFITLLGGSICGVATRGSRRRCRCRFPKSG
jgi:hypothetical protein